MTPARSDIDAETIETLETLLDAARTGAVTGVSCVVLRRGDDYSLHTTGACARKADKAIFLHEMMVQELGAKVRAGWPR